MNPRKRPSTSSRDRLIEEGQRADQAIKKWFAMTGADVANSKELMPYLVKQEVFSKDHREGLPLRKLLRRLEAAGQLSVITTACFDQKPTNKSCTSCARDQLPLRSNTKAHGTRYWS